MEASLLRLAIAFGLGALAGQLKLFEHPRYAVSSLNTFLLYFAFPCLIYGNVANSELHFLHNLGFVLAILIPSAIVVAVWAQVAQNKIIQPSTAGAAIQAATFGNIAYLGIPITGSLLGVEYIPLASCIAALHIVIGLTVGTYFFARVARVPIVGQSLIYSILRQPLVWASVGGISINLMGIATPAVIMEPVQWIARGAGPVALFMIGLYSHNNRSELLQLAPADAVLISSKLVLLPACTIAVSLGAQRVFDLPTDQVAAITIISLMPVGIANFSIAESLHTATGTMVRSIVVSTAIFMPILLVVIRFILPS